ncbi:PepSY domain-containing protein [Oceanobacillus alkalisoli]|uniref:PepSY domain-containing protein n=1 Tax=Oceanobacillus alkalisoli TaxID=2925113 RepID=UPI001F11A14C|nr:PepSY domain-containing protein [Oceanobacillus alkalisoli]MCF3944631.1 PepSY domain-containing protein [Oceanobacillus alkalisoli]
MNKKTGLGIGLLAICSVIGFTAYQSNAAPTEPIVAASETKEETVEKQDRFDGVLSIEEAKQIALTEFEGKVTEIELDEDDGRLMYEVELKNETHEAEIELDARTGDIIELDIEEDDDRWDD